MAHIILNHHSVIQWRNLLGAGRQHSIAIESSGVVLGPAVALAWKAVALKPDGGSTLIPLQVYDRVSNSIGRRVGLLLRPSFSSDGNDSRCAACPPAFER
jgi:hypothetical protein